MSVTPRPERKRALGTPPGAPSKKIKLNFDADKVDLDTHELDLRTITFPLPLSDEFRDMVRGMAEDAQTKSKVTFQIGGPGAGSFHSVTPDPLIFSQIMAVESVARRLISDLSQSIQIEVDRRMFCRPEAVEKMYAIYMLHCLERHKVGFGDFSQGPGVQDMLQAYANDRDIAAKNMERDFNDVVEIYDSCKEVGAVALSFV
tara:strand:+ start:1222 stop:1827 length:606 start_codon:yes stop_codon:yes gene_type:complete